jgi:hypothetical protein
MSKWHVQSHSN